MNIETAGAVSIVTIIKKWVIVLAKLITLLVISVTICAIVYVNVKQLRLSGVVLLGVFGYLAAFPRSLNGLMGLTKNYPKIYVRIVLVPALISALVCIFPPNGKDTASNSSTTKKTGNDSAQAYTSLSQSTKPIPASAERQAPPAKSNQVNPETQVTWSDNTLSNNSSIPLLGVTLKCKLFYKNGKIADESKQKLTFDEGIGNEPFGPSESKLLRAKFDYSGNKDDIDKNLTTCATVDPQFAAVNPDNLPLSISVSAKQSESGSPLLVGVLKNESIKDVVVNKLMISCFVTQQQKSSTEEIMRRAFNGQDTPEYGYLENYHALLIARPLYTSTKETKVKIPASGSVDVRLFKKGGMFSADEEIPLRYGKITSQYCWITS